MDSAAPKRAKILVVDDQEQNVLLLEELLEQAGSPVSKSALTTSSTVSPGVDET